MDSKTRLEKNRSGKWEIRWTEKDPDTGATRTRSSSTRTEDRDRAEIVKRHFDQASYSFPVSYVLLRDVLNQYYVAATQRGIHSNSKYILPPLFKYFGGMTAEEITPAEVDAYVKQRKVAPGTVRRELALLTAALNWARRRQILKEVPVIDKPADGPPRAVFLLEDVERELFELAAQDTDPKTGRLSIAGRMICVGLETGARREALVGLRWDHVDLKRNTLDFRKPRVAATKKQRVVTPITDRLRPVLERAWAERAEGGGVFVIDTPGAGERAFARFAARHGFTGLTPHVMRHTRITLLLRAGVTVWDVSAIVGVSVAMIMKVYGHHVSDDRLRAEANRRAA